MRCLSAKSHKISNPRDIGAALCYPSEIWQGLDNRTVQGSIYYSWGHSSPKSHGCWTSLNLVAKSLTGHWIQALNGNIILLNYIFPPPSWTRILAFVCDVGVLIILYYICASIKKNFQLHCHQYFIEVYLYGIRFFTVSTNCSGSMVICYYGSGEAIKIYNEWIDLCNAMSAHRQRWGGINGGVSLAITVKPVYNDHLMGYLSAFWSSSRWPRAT